MPNLSLPPITQAAVDGNGRWTEPWYRYLVGLAGDGAVLSDIVDASGPLVILASGQSNIIDAQDYDWSPPSNLTVWNWSFADTETPGTAFVTPSSTQVTYAEAFAGQVAKENPTREVRLIILGYADISITHWLEGTSFPDVYSWFEDNVPPALTAAGADKVDLFLWWQGGSDLNARTEYPDRFEELIDRLEGETWWLNATPILIAAVAPTSISGAAQSDLMNVVLIQVAGEDPLRRQFFNLGALTDPTLWRDTAHMTGEGYYFAGLLAYESYKHGYGRSALGGIYTSPIDPTSLTVPGGLAVVGGTVLAGTVLGPASIWSITSGGAMTAQSLGVGILVVNPIASFIETTTPSTPAAGQVLLYAKSDKKLYALDSNGLESALF